MYFSIIIPVYNRPEELDELLQSIALQQNVARVEVIVVEDGSNVTAKDVVNKHKNTLQLKYFYKENSGPADSRNYGMQTASGDYFIILDSDCILPENYLEEVTLSLESNYTDAYGGADAAHPGFTTIQKAINYSMTSFLTTGGLRGNEKARNKFQLRSFNLGISKQAFNKIKGFSKQHFGEDIDLTFKLWNANFETQFIPKAFVYHKRRTNFKQFLKQTFNFGAARPVLNKMHPNSAKITFWFPFLFMMGFIVAITLLFLGNETLMILFGIYFLVIFFDAINKNRCYGETCLTSIKTGVYAIIATLVQFIGYGSGFIRSIFRLFILSKTKEEAFPNMFYSDQKF